MKQCLRKKCDQKFEPTKPKQRYCSNKCRTYAYRENLVKEKKSEGTAVDISEIAKETDTKKATVSKFKTYDYSKMPTGLNYSGREAWKKKARIEQDKLNTN